MTPGAIVILLTGLLVLFLVWIGAVLRPKLIEAQSDKKNRRIIPSDEMLDYAERAALREDYDSALKLCGQIFDQPQAYEVYPQALSLRIDLLVRLHRYDEAIEDMRRLALLEPLGIAALNDVITQANDAPAEFLHEARKLVAGLEL